MGCLAGLIYLVLTWFATYFIVEVLSWLIGFTFTVGLVTGVWLIILVLKLLF